MKPLIHLPSLADIQQFSSLSKNDVALAVTFFSMDFSWAVKMDSQALDSKAIETLRALTLLVIPNITYLSFLLPSSIFFNSCAISSVVNIAVFKAFLPARVGLNFITSSFVILCQIGRMIFPPVISR